METRFSPLTGNWVIRRSTILLNNEAGYGAFQSPYGELGNTTSYPELCIVVKFGEFQSPYGELGNTTYFCFGFSSFICRRFSPLTGNWVIRLCLPVPALGAGPQTIFSNLGLFSPFSGTRVQNQNRTVSFFPLVTPFLALFEIFKPTGFLTLK